MSNELKNISNESNLLKYKEEFETIYGIIATHRKRVVRVVNNESMSMVWEVGGYVSYKQKTSAWGEGVVRQLSDYIRMKDPTARGWSYRTLYKMVQLYDAYSVASFADLLAQTDMSKYGEIVPFETAQMEDGIIVPFDTYNSSFFQTKITKIIAFNYKALIFDCKNLSYVSSTGIGAFINLWKAIRLQGGNFVFLDVQSKVMANTYPDAPLLFKDKVFLEMLGLPLEYKESKLRKEIIAHMKDFILELGKDFLFIDDEHRIAVGGKTFKVDLLFYHRLLQCMVAIELKTDEFHPKDLGQLEFYLEALDQEERRSNENPSIGIILCKDADMEVVRYALNRSMSPTMVALYKEQLQVGGVIQRSLVEFCKFLNEGGKKR